MVKQHGCPGSKCQEDRSTGDNNHKALWTPRSIRLTQEVSQVPPHAGLPHRGSDRKRCHPLTKFREKYDPSWEPDKPASFHNPRDLSSFRPLGEPLRSSQRIKPALSRDKSVHMLHEAQDDVEGWGFQNPQGVAQVQELRRSFRGEEIPVVEDHEEKNQGTSLCTIFTMIGVACGVLCIALLIWGKISSSRKSNWKLNRKSPEKNASSDCSVSFEEEESFIHRYKMPIVGLGGLCASIPILSYFYNKSGSGDAQTPSETVLARHGSKIAVGGTLAALATAVGVAAYNRDSKSSGSVSSKPVAAQSHASKQTNGKVVSRNSKPTTEDFTSSMPKSNPPSVSDWTEGDGAVFQAPNHPDFVAPPARRASVCPQACKVRKLDHAVTKDQTNSGPRSAESRPSQKSERSSNDSSVSNQAQSSNNGAITSTRRPSMRPQADKVKPKDRASLGRKSGPRPTARSSHPTTKSHPSHSMPGRDQARELRSRASNRQQRNDTRSPEPNAQPKITGDQESSTQQDSNPRARYWHRDQIIHDPVPDVVPNPGRAEPVRDSGRPEPERNETHTAEPKGILRDQPSSSEKRKNVRFSEEARTNHERCPDRNGRIPDVSPKKTPVSMREPGRREPEQMDRDTEPTRPAPKRKSYAKSDRSFSSMIEFYNKLSKGTWQFQEDNGSWTPLEPIPNKAYHKAFREFDYENPQLTKVVYTLSEDEVKKRGSGYTNEDVCIFTADFVAMTAKNEKGTKVKPIRLVVDDVPQKLSEPPQGSDEREIRAIYQGKQSYEGGECQAVIFIVPGSGIKQPNHTFMFPKHAEHPSGTGRPFLSYGFCKRMGMRKNWEAFGEPIVVNDAKHAWKLAQDAFVAAKAHLKRTAEEDQRKREAEKAEKLIIFTPLFEKACGASWNKTVPVKIPMQNRTEQYDDKLALQLEVNFSNMIAKGKDGKLILLKCLGHLELKSSNIKWWWRFADNDDGDFKPCWGRQCIEYTRCYREYLKGTLRPKCHPRNSSKKYETMNFGGMQHANAPPGHGATKIYTQMGAFGTKNGIVWYEGEKKYFY